VPELRLLSWNVNSVRSLKRHGFLDWLKKDSPDILCLQETKVSPELVDDELKNPPGYFTYWSGPIGRSGYAGVATFSKPKPIRVQYGFGVDLFDIEGRVIMSTYPWFTLFNIYFPNGKSGPVRLQFKMDFYEVFLDYLEPMRARGDKLIICGDINTAHTAIDLARPKANEKISGFLPQERAWIDKLLDRGWLDTFRHFNQEPGHYSWWDIKTAARTRNVGWRIDAFYVTQNLLPSLKNAFILSDVMGSDHCPVGINLSVD
jgi:exodeoxyribonuclease III